MKKQFLLILAFVTLLHSAIAADNTNGRIVVYFATKVNIVAKPYEIMANDSLVARIRNNSFAEYTCKPGSYNIRITNAPTANTSINVVAGKSYFVQIMTMPGFWKPQPIFMQVDSISGNNIIKNYGVEKLDKDFSPFPRAARRFSVSVISGAGFTDKPIVYLNNGDEATISAGGGVGIGLKYGYEINRFFDLSFEYNYHYSMLMPNVKNANVSFSNSSIAITPSLIIPYADGDVTRFRLGAGIDKYFGENLNLKTSQLAGGLDHKFNYTSNIGTHINFVYETNLTKTWSMNLELIYHNINFDFKPSVPGEQVDPNFNKMDGSGIDLNIGVSYHF